MKVYATQSAPKARPGQHINPSLDPTSHLRLAFYSLVTKARSSRRSIRSRRQKQLDLSLAVLHITPAALACQSGADTLGKE